MIDMPAGLECINEAGQRTLSIGDRVTTFHSSGVATFSASAPGTRVYVPVTNMTPDGSWVVNVTDTNELLIQDGGFYIYLYVQFPNAPGFYRKAPWVVYRC